MHINDLLLTKEEIPILFETAFHIPIHPRLLSSDIELDPDLAKKVFPLVIDDWYSELKKYTVSLEDAEKKEWIQEAFLKKKPVSRLKCCCYELDCPIWESNVLNSENGFANVLRISRNSGGGIYFHKDKYDFKRWVSLEKNSGYIRFSREKALEFNSEKEIYPISDEEGVHIFIYKQHNVDHHPGALFLRNWGILYLNEAMKEVLKD